MTPEAKALGDQPAFPCPVNLGLSGEVCNVSYYGLTKREWLVGMAMQSLILSQKTQMEDKPYLPGFDGIESEFDKWIACRSEELAAAQLEQLAKATP